MSSLNNIYQKMASALESGALAKLHHESPGIQENQIGREVAHELNNILTIIQGYADRLVLKHAENPALRRDLQLISDNSRRAVAAIKKARGPATPQTPAGDPTTVQARN
ncbi:MAG TPA: histidine kinase dimerization/phospho-acceptor domain-containing protein [Candidatus Acidoferrales bacterium]|nr:histidine kinase dimerization/phospho-acceptor domain-containing protein [Candidatus Acidoferrales bacterium]